MYPVAFVGGAALYGMSVTYLSRIAVRWVCLLGLAFIAPHAADILFENLATPLPDAVIYFKPGTTDEQHNYAMDQLFRAPSEQGSQFIDGIEGLSSIGERRGIRISFRPRTNSALRAMIISHAGSANFVDRIIDARRITKEDIERFRREMESGDALRKQAAWDSLRRS